MTVAEWSQLLTAIAAVGGLLVSLYNALRINRVSRQTNSMKDELIVEVRAAAHEKGREIGRREAVATQEDFHDLMW